MRRRWLIPETVQTSGMDCGPAALKALLEGFRIHASYGRLREACQTDVDGTSIDQIEEAANQLGLEAEQTVVPPDHLLRAETEMLPAIVVVTHAGGATHFVVVWRRHGRWLQIMDPAVGRRWSRCESFLDTLYRHEQAVPRDAWLEWAQGDGFQAPLRARLRELGAGAPECGPAAIDAATRMTEALASAGAISRGREADGLLRQLAGREEMIPDQYWSAAPGGDPDEVRVRGAVVLRVAGARRVAAGDATISPELAAALEEPPARPGRDLWRLVRQDGLLAPAALVFSIALAAAGVVFEALLFRGLFEIGRELTLSGQRLASAAALLLFLAALLTIEWPLAAGLLRSGRHLEARLRVALYRKIPVLGDRYFQSRLISDMAERAHTIHAIRQLPPLAGQFLRTVCELALTAAGIAWLDPASALPAAAAAVAAVAIPRCAQRVLTERDLRWRNHTGGLSRFYLDALTGLTAIRAHGAQPAIRHEQSSLLAEWARAGLALVRAAVAVEGIEMLIGVGLAIWLLLGRLARGGDPAGLLLFTYWALNLPALGAEVAGLAKMYPGLRNTALRLMEPLGAKEEPLQAAHDDGVEEIRGGVSISLENVSVRVAGHTILSDVNVHVSAGEHVGVVGPSGAGKSSLVGLLLGWHRASEGRVMVDGQAFEGGHLAALRRRTAWVDPQVRLWNRSLLENLRYGAESDGPMDAAFDRAELMPVLRNLPDGMQTRMGEGGALVSGGEGQRVRLGRALLRPGIRLAVLDEPARGLDRESRRRILANARCAWKDATLIAITHDVCDTLDMQRVLVVEGGRVVEDGCPEELARREDSRYRALLEADKAVRDDIWANRLWRRLRVENGTLVESVR